MDSQVNEVLGKIDSHLDQAKQLMAGLIHPEVTPSVQPASQDGKFRELYQASERRANEAEVRLSKLSREISFIEDRAANSVREIQRLAFQDELTGLANSHLMRQHLDLLVASCKLNFQVLVIIVDLDRFQMVNQMLGHDMGDELLKRVGERLSQLVRQNSAVARLSEDEFAIVVPDIPIKEVASQARALAENIRRQLATPFSIQGQNIDLTVSQGGSYLPELAKSSREVLQQSRSALSQAKQQGRNQFQLYTPALHHQQQRNAAVEFHLKYALEGKELFADYLPFLKLSKTRAGIKCEVVGVEALLRWNHRVEGLLPPDQFLPVAERTGQIVPIGEFVIDTVCRQQKLWAQEGVKIFANINLSGRQLLEGDLADKLASKADLHQVPRDSINLEFHEGFGLSQELHIDQSLGKIRGAGFCLALDKFGESASTLQRLDQVTYLKLAPTLVKGDPELCVKALTIAQGLGLVPIAVGIEDLQTALFLLEYGCDMMQGFLFSKPINAKAVSALYKSPPTFG